MARRAIPGDNVDGVGLAADGRAQVPPLRLTEVKGRTVKHPGAREPEYGMVIAKDVMIPMRDGVRLAADVYKPAVNGEPVPGPLPTILGRTSYDKTSHWMWIEPVANFFTPRGYVVVVEDLRGRYQSEGKGQYFH